MLFSYNEQYLTCTPEAGHWYHNSAANVIVHASLVIVGLIAVLCVSACFILCFLSV